MLGLHPPRFLARAVVYTLIPFILAGALVQVAHAEDIDNGGAGNSSDATGIVNETDICDGTQLNQPMIDATVAHPYLQSHDQGYRYGTHFGVDYVSDVSDQVFAVLDGVVVRAGDGYEGYENRQGHIVVVQSTLPCDVQLPIGRTIPAGETVYFTYMHLGQFDVEPGTRLTRGDLIGRIDTNTDDPHLHMDAIFRTDPSQVAQRPIEQWFAEGKLIDPSAMITEQSPSPVSNFGRWDLTNTSHIREMGNLCRSSFTDLLNARYLENSYLNNSVGMAERLGKACLALELYLRPADQRATVRVPNLVDVYNRADEIRWDPIASTRTDGTYGDFLNQFRTGSHRNALNPLSGNDAAREYVYEAFRDIGDIVLQQSSTLTGVDPRRVRNTEDLLLRFGNNPSVCAGAEAVNAFNAIMGRMIEQEVLSSTLNAVFNIRQI